MNQNEINVTANYLKKLASLPDAENRIALYLDSLFACASQQKGSFDVQQNKTTAVSTVIQFTEKEIKNMASTFKKIFIANGLCAHVLKKPSGKNSYCYEIRYRANGFDIRTSSTNLQKAKEKFLKKTTSQEIEKYRIQKIGTPKNLFCDIFEEWHQYKKGTILDKELKRFHVNFYNLPLELQNKPISEVKTIDLDKIMKEVKPRKYEELRTLFNGIFKYAIASGIITINPVTLIQFKKAERKSKDALPTEEIMNFFANVKDSKYDNIRQGLYLLYFFGLRPCEIDEETRREGEFLITRNRKRKQGKIEYKKIPIPKQSQGLINWDTPLTFNCSTWKRDTLIKELLGEKTGYYFRHTFSTLCQEKVRPDIVDIWMGDSPQRLVGKVYTHFSDKFMREQMDLVEFPIPPL